MTTSAPIEEQGSLEEHRTRSARSMERLSGLASFVVALAIILALLYLLSDVLLVLFAAALLASQLIGSANAISRWTRLPYGAALAAVVVSLFAAIGLVAWLHGPDIVREVQIIYGNAQDQIGQLWTTLGHIDWLKSAVDKARDYADHLTTHAAGYAAGFVTTTIGGFGTVLLIVVAALYLASAPDLYAKGMVALMPQGWRQRGAAVFRQEGHTLRWWFIGQLADMAFIGLLVAIGLFSLGLPLWPMLAVIAALFNFVPYIGALAGSVPAILVGLSISPSTALWVAILFAAVQTLEGNVISPLISKRTVELPPVVTLLSQTVLGTLFGPMGLILATPITAAGMVLVRMVYQESILGDPPRALKHGD